MMEPEWLACNDPQTMGKFLRGKASERKCRLLACGLLRRSMPSTNHPALASVAFGERWADGAVTEEDVRAFQSADPTANWAALVQPAHDLLHLCANALGDAWRLVPDLLRELCGNPFRPAPIDPPWLAWNHGTAVTGILVNPIYTGVGPFPRSVEDAAWVRACARLIEEEGPQQLLVNLLHVLRECFQRDSSV